MSLILLLCCVDLIFVYMVSIVQCRVHSTLFKPHDVPLYTILMQYYFSTEKNRVSMSTSSSLLIEILIHTSSTFPFFISEIICSLDFFCDLMKIVPSPVNQGCCPSLTGSLYSSGHLKKWHLDPASQSHHEMSAPLCTYTLLLVKSVLTNKSLELLL